MNENDHESQDLGDDLSPANAVAAATEQPVPQGIKQELFAVLHADSDDVNGLFRRDVNKVGAQRRW
ncbi:MAG: hypothetical protein JWQ55_1539 [Rhodopila sp.]|nr:hypothetical protein [Rhodopila sp.]